MENKHKNVVIVVLVALVLVLAVGYAAFAQQLNINGTANITSTWDVHFDDTKTGDIPGVIEANPGFVGGQAPKGTLTFTDVHNATLTADLKQPGDTVKYTLTIVNGGNITASLGTPTVTMDGDTDGEALTATKGNIKFTVTNPANTTIADGETTTMTVTAEYVDNAGGNTNAQNETASVTITLNATQAA